MLKTETNDMTTNNYPPQLVLQQIIQGFQVTQCIYVAAKLGIADLLKDGPRTSEELAQVTGTHAPSLYRVLRLLTWHEKDRGLFTQHIFDGKSTEAHESRPANSR